MLLLALFAAYVAAAPLDAPHAAVLGAISRDDVSAGCPPQELRRAASSASIRALGRVGGDDVILASVQSTCICGAQNCPYMALRLTPEKARVLMWTFGVTFETVPDAPLPRIVVRAHDSAAIAVEDTFAYRGGAYALIGSARVRWADNARKPSGVPVRFAANASSARLHGRISLGWYDEYVFDASKGQKLVIDGVTSPAPVTLTLYGPAGAPTAGVSAGTPITLPQTGTYRLHVDSGSETDVPYALTLAIR